LLNDKNIVTTQLFFQGAAPNPSFHNNDWLTQVFVVSVLEYKTAPPTNLLAASLENIKIINKN
jgi:hypothetical protein